MREKFKAGFIAVSAKLSLSPVQRMRSERWIMAGFNLREQSFSSTGLNFRSRIIRDSIGIN